MFALGRFTSTYLMQFIRPNVLMGILALANIALLSMAIALPGWIGLWALMLTSFCMSLMYPTIFALGLKGLGPNTTLGASLLVMAIIGGAAVTPLLGWVAERAHSMAKGFVVPLGCYVAVAYFSFYGSRTRLLPAEVLHADHQHQATI